MKKRILSMLLAFLLFFSLFPANDLFAEASDGELTLWYQDPAAGTLVQAEAVELYRGGELYLSALSAGGVSGGFQWQIEAEQGLWVDIQGGTASELRVSYGMVKSLLRGNAVRMRCTQSLEEALYTSDPVTVTVTDTDTRILTGAYALQRELTAPALLSAPAQPDSDSLLEAVSRQLLQTETAAVEQTANDDPVNEDITIYTITIEYIYAEDSKFAGQRVALPYIAEVAAGQTLTETVTSPNSMGYTPDVAAIDLSALGPVSGNHAYTVSYSPAEVSYTVRHYQQNVGNDEYTWVDTTMASGKTEALTSDAAANTYVGFTALSHYHEEIAADSSTTIDIYYDRNYYLMSFDLNGGYGVNAVYARYGAELAVANPRRAGYSFRGWSLDGTTESELPAVMPAENRTYKALWTAGNTTYTVAYWLENPDIEGQYDFAGTASIAANSGDAVCGEDGAVDKGVFTAEEYQYYSYNADKTDSVVIVAGDGSSVVNVYYDRSEYTLKFYYARYNGAVYQVATNTNGSSNYGGTVGDAGWSGSYTEKPTLDATYTELSETIDGYTYYYFLLTAKYGANLQSVWPNAPLSDAASTVKFVSWGTQYGSGYNINHSDNKNIKGVYSVMDSGLLIDPAVTADQGVNHWMVGYWGNPTMYVYEIYYSLLAGETADRTYSGVGYKKVTQYTVGSTALPSGGQTPLSFEGVEYLYMDYDSDTKVDGTVIRFYYQRSQHSLTLNDNYNTSIDYTIPYGGLISDYVSPVPEPDYPAELPERAYSFGGWYQSKEGIGELDTSLTMPNEDLLYYAKWNAQTYTVYIYSDDPATGDLLSTMTVSYGSLAAKPTDPVSEDDSTFIGWYYIDETGSEQRFDFDNMVITGDITIYAKWRSNVMKQVEISYVLEDENGNLIQIADKETLMLRVGQIRTFDAKTGSSLYEEYRAGCFPTTATHSITPELQDLESDEPITWTFLYKQYGKVPYQVEFYVQEPSSGELRPAFINVDGAARFVTSEEYLNGYYDPVNNPYIEQHWDNDKAVVTELYVPDVLADSAWTLPAAYLPDALKVQKVIVPSQTDPANDIAANTIRFVYTYEEPEQNEQGETIYKARYLVQHFIQIGTEDFDIYSYTDNEAYSGDVVTASPISIPGYTYSPSLTEQYKEQGTTLSEDGSTMTGTVSAQNDMALNFFYTVNAYPYQVMYLEQDTNRVLQEAKTTDSDGNLLTGQYGAKVTEQAEAIPGYDPDAAEKTIYIQMEAGTAASVNTIVFYYTRKSADLIISKTVALDEEQAKEEGISGLPEEALTQPFTFTVTCPTGFHKSVYDYTITNADGTKVSGKLPAGTTSMSFTLRHGQSIAIHDLAMGSYTVTETYVPGFRTSVDGIIRQSYDMELVSANESVTAAFLNSYPFYVGDLVLRKNVAKLDAADPEATEPYKVTVVLTPDDAAREVDRVISWTDGDGSAKSFTVPALTGTEDQNVFTLDVWMPVNGEVKLEGVPVGGFTATETVDSTGYITDYYTVTYNKALHQNDEVSGTNYVVSGVIHGGHPTAVTFSNTYKKGTLTINKTVTQEYANDSWQQDTFTFEITGTTELPDGSYAVAGAQVTVSGGVVTVKDENGNNPTLFVEKTEGESQWSGSLSFAGLPAGYYTVKEIASEGGLEQYIASPETGYEALLVNNTAAATEADFVNTYKRSCADLTITTVSADDSQSFLFHVVCTEDPSISLQVVLVGSDSQTIRDLPAGHYTVTEQNQWSWRESAVTEQTVALTDQSLTVPFDFGQVDRLRWLSGFHYNIRRKGGS